MKIDFGALAQLARAPAELSPYNKQWSTWGTSSFGRAPALQAGGGRFETGVLHQVIIRYGPSRPSTSLRLKRGRRFDSDMLHHSTHYVRSWL